MTDLASVLFGREAIDRRVGELGRAITRDYAEREPVLVTVLKGGAVFLADLMRGIDRPVETHFLAVSRYVETASSSGRVRILLDLDLDLSGRHVLLVEDIVDTGMTLRYLSSVLTARGPASFEVVTLLNRSVRRIVPITPRYVGFDCPDAFVVGYGLDFDERYRNLADIIRVDDLPALQADPEALAPLLGGTAP